MQIVSDFFSLFLLPFISFFFFYLISKVNSDEKEKTAASAANMLLFKEKAKDENIGIGH